MHDKELYEKLLGLSNPWKVVNVDLNMEASKVTVCIGHDPLSMFPCPECGKLTSVYDHRKRSWRHLDTCGFVTIIEAEVPRIQCLDHGTKQVVIPWAESGSRFTAMFESMCISWLRVAPISAVSERMRISWDEAWGIMGRAVKRGLARRTLTPVEDLAIDETSFQKRHEYVTVLVNRKTSQVVDILDDRKKKTLKSWLKENKNILKEVRSITMDMWVPFINAVKETIPNAESKICFDRFHVASYFGKALDMVRSQEHKALSKQGVSPLSRTKHDWLRSKAKGGYKHRNTFFKMTRLNLQTARAWRIKETANGLWHYSYRKVAEGHWKSLLSWISRSRLKPMIKVGKMVRRHLWGILNAVVLQATNAVAESINATIQKIKSRACGFRSRTRFRIAILFHRGGLSMLPDGVLEP